MAEKNGSAHRGRSILLGLAAVAVALLGGRGLVDDHPDAQPGNGAHPAPTTQVSKPAANAVPACSTVPREAWATIDEVKRGGPYEYPGYDDTRFGNYQNELPQEKLGYYREYTVDTPGVNHRGERRIITGGGDDGHVDEWYYTGDHYESFCEVTGVK